MTIVVSSISARPRRQLIRVEPLRRWLGLNQHDFAQAIRVNRSTIARWERGKTGPAPTTAQGLVVAAVKDVKNLAVRIWGEEEARRWLRHSLGALQNRTPIEVLVSEGPLRIRDLLLDELDGGYA